MKRIVLLLSIVWVSLASVMAQTQHLKFDNDAEFEGVTLLKSDESGVQLKFAIKGMDIIPFSAEDIKGDIVNVNGMLNDNAPGYPSLPNRNLAFAIPFGSNVSLSVTNCKYENIKDVDVIPAPTETIDGDEVIVSYVKNKEIYGNDKFYPSSHTLVSETKELRGVQVVYLSISPIQYNPVSQEIIVCHEMEVTLSFDGGKGYFCDNSFRSPYWDPILKKQILNFHLLPNINYEERMQEWTGKRSIGCEYLIIIPDNEAFREHAQTLANYRIRQGVLTKVMSMGDMGCNSSDELELYLRNAYENWDIKPVAICILGDHNNDVTLGVPAKFFEPCLGSTPAPTDNYYVSFDENMPPQIAITRLPADNANEAKIMVSKQIEYEYIQPNTDDSYYNHPLVLNEWQEKSFDNFQVFSGAICGYWKYKGRSPKLIGDFAGQDGHYNPYPLDTTAWDNNMPQSYSYSTLNDSTDYLFYYNLFGYNGMRYITKYPSDFVGWSNGNTNKIKNAIEGGTFFIYKSGHGQNTLWGNPRFTIGDALALKNIGKMTFVFTNSCYVGNFSYGGTCLLEGFMRCTYSGKNTGAVGCMGGTCKLPQGNTPFFYCGVFDYFDPDFITDSLEINYANRPDSLGWIGTGFDAHLREYPANGYSERNWMPAFGMVAGKSYPRMNINTNYMDMNSNSIQYGVHTFSDAFLRLYTQVPQTMDVCCTMVSNRTVNVTAPAGAVVALTKDNGGILEILAVATATGEEQAIHFESQETGTTIRVTATKQDYLRWEKDLVVGNIYACSGIYNLLDYGIDSGLPDITKVSVLPCCPGQKIKVRKNGITGRFRVGVYNGLNETTSALIGIYDERTMPNRIYADNPSGALTFLFLTNGDCGCDVVVSCEDLNLEEHGCGGKFYDSGFAENNYGNNENYEGTFYPEGENKAISLDFNLMNNCSGDTLFLYDGPTTSAPLLGAYGSTLRPFSVTATNPSGAMSYRFVSDVAQTAQGWDADISCQDIYIMQNGSILAKGGKFYDSGGGSGKYSKNEDYTLTLEPLYFPQRVQVSFSSFDLATSTYLYVYDGPTATGTPMATYSRNNIPTTITAGQMGCLTFRFVSPRTKAPQSGWVATVSLINGRDCQDNLGVEDELSKEVTIYPNPTNGNVNIEATDMQRVTICNSLGQIVLDMVTEDETLSFDTNILPEGIYFVKITMTDGSVLKKLSVVK